MKRNGKKYHGNSRKNEKPHHLYEIIDDIDQSTFKYGISADPIDEDGLSERIRTQLFLFNIIAGMTRFFARILLRNIPGRIKALEIEDRYIKKHEETFGHRPPGNPKRRKRKKKDNGD